VTTTNLPTEALNAPLTDLGNAEVLAALIGRRFRYDHERQQWFAFIAHRWVPVVDSQLIQPAVSCVRLRRKAAVDAFESDPDTAKALMKWAQRSEAAPRLKAMIEVASGLDALNAAYLVQPGDTRLWDHDPYLLGVPNGVVDLRTGELRDGQPEDRITVQTKIPYDPTATAPRWERFMVEVLPDPVTREWRRRFMGYSLTGLVHEEKLVFDIGGGRNGKSTFLGTVRSVLGDYYWTLQASSLLDSRRGAHTTELTDLEARRIVNVSEMTENASLNEERVKSIVSVDPITARRMRKDSRTFLPTHKLWLSTNNLPRIKDVTEGIWRRIKVVPWTQEFPVDDTVKHELEAELSGILRWLVEAACDYNRLGLAPESEEMTKASGAYREGEDELLDWRSARIVADEGAFLTNTDAMRDYVDWSRQHGTLPQHQLNPITFGRMMSRHYGSTVNKKVGGKQVRGWDGVRLSLESVAFDADDARATWSGTGS